VQFRRTALAAAGQAEPAPFPAPDIANLLNDWLDAAQLLHWQEHGQIDFALNLALRCAAARQRRPYQRGISLVLRSF
jgi:twitching motility protein PilT